VNEGVRSKKLKEFSPEDREIQITRCPFAARREHCCNGRLILKPTDDDSPHLFLQSRCSSALGRARVKISMWFVSTVCIPPVCHWGEGVGYHVTGVTQRKVKSWETDGTHTYTLPHTFNRHLLCTQMGIAAACLSRTEISQCSQADV